MKKCIAILLMVSTSVLINANSPQVFIKNNYGAELAYNFNNREGLRLPSGRTEPLGDANSIYKLEIRTTGWGSSLTSPFSSLMYKISNIQKSDIKGLDAVLVINASDALSDWNIDLVWEPTEETRIKFDQRPDWRMQLIENGFLGLGFKKFASQVCSANYTEAIKINGINLCQYMREEIKKVSFRSLGGFFGTIQKQFNSMKSAGVIK